MYRPSVKFCTVFVRVCVVTIIVSLTVWVLSPAFDDKLAATLVLGGGILLAVMGAWHDGHALGEQKGRESGSVLFIILVAVVLFAALTAALNQGSRTSSAGMLTDQQARLAAAEIISYGDSIAQAVHRLQIKGCSEQEIDFSDHGGVAMLTNGDPINFPNPFKREDGSCGIFHPNGGGVTPHLVNAGYVDASIVPSAWMHPRSMTLTQFRVEGVGTDGVDGSGSDLVLFRGRLTDQVCREVNRMLGVGDFQGKVAPETDGMCTTSTFKGVYTACTNSAGDTMPDIVGKKAFCWRNNEEHSRHYVQVLIAR